MRVVIYHNPGCSNSRGALALIRERGIEPEVVEYLSAPPDRATLAWLAQASGLGPRGFLDGIQRCGCGQAGLVSQYSLVQALEPPTGSIR